MRTQSHEVGGPRSTTEATLFQQAQAGRSDSLVELMECHDGLVQAGVHQQVLGDLPFTEALQAGRIGLWRAILGFDPNRGLTFSTYAWLRIMPASCRARYGGKSRHTIVSALRVRLGMNMIPWMGQTTQWCGKQKRCGKHCTMRYGACPNVCSTLSWPVMV